MPIYEYHCHACGHDFEILQKINETNLTTCPHCQKQTVERLVSAAGFQLKGTGWYATDFKNKPTPAVKSDTGKETATASTPVSTNTKKESVKDK